MLPVPKLVSVLLPVRNGAQYIAKSIQSILEQTYSNFELIVIDDGSNDSTLEILNSFKDSRLKVYTTSGIGLVEALNLAFNKSNGEYIARMDADDISHVDRFRKQVDVLDKDEKIGVVCTDIEVIDEFDRTVGFERDVIKSKRKLIEGLTFKRKMKPVVHPTVMIRRNLLISSNGYRNYKSAEDKDLWLRLVSITEFYRMPQPLLKYRHNTNGVSAKNFIQQKANSMLAVLSYEVYKRLNIDLYFYNDILAHYGLLFYRFSAESHFKYERFNWLKNEIKKRKGIRKIVFLAKNGFSPSVLDCYFFNQRRSAKVIAISLQEIVDKLKMK